MIAPTAPGNLQMITPTALHNPQMITLTALHNPQMSYICNTERTTGPLAEGQ